jgi:hypothetical protein
MRLLGAIFSFTLFPRAGRPGVKYFSMPSAALFL